MRKMVFVINGRGGVGKDTLCELAAKAYSVKNVSSITPIKELAAQVGRQLEGLAVERKAGILNTVGHAANKGPLRAIVCQVALQRIVAAGKIYPVKQNGLNTAAVINHVYLHFAAIQRVKMNGLAARKCAE